ncbi:MAG: hypothetical protein AABX11_05480 [Nanoarchaeota archaeon]
MIKVLIIESTPECAFKCQIESLADIKNLPVSVELSDSVDHTQIPNNYDIYVLHTTQIRPLDEFPRLRRDNPQAYIIARNTWHQNVPISITSSVNVWDDWITGKMFGQALDYIAGRRQAK